MRGVGERANRTWTGRLRGDPRLSPSRWDSSPHLRWV